MCADPPWRLNQPRRVPQDAGGGSLRLAMRHSAGETCVNAARTAAVVTRKRNHFTPAYSIGGRIQVRHQNKALVCR